MSAQEIISYSRTLNSRTMRHAAATKSNIAASHRTTTSRWDFNQLTGETNSLLWFARLATRAIVVNNVRNQKPSVRKTWISISHMFRLCWRCRRRRTSNSHVRLMCIACLIIIIVYTPPAIVRMERIIIGRSVCGCGYTRTTIINVFYHYPAIVESNFPKPKSGTPSHALVFNDAFAISKQSIFYLRGGRPNKSRQRQLGILFPFDGCMRTSLLVQLLWHSVAGARTRHGKTRNKFVRCLVTEWPYGPRDNKIMHARRTTA